MWLPKILAASGASVALVSVHGTDGETPRFECPARLTFGGL